MLSEEVHGLNKKERREVESRLRVRPAVVYEIIRAEGAEELDRTFNALWWSGVAAGLSIGFSMLGAGVMKATLPADGWSELLIAIGYSFGFLIVVLGRQQLFTENTLTAVLPLLSSNGFLGAFKRMARLWAIVLLANVLGAVFFALVVAKTPLIGQAYHPAMMDIGLHLVDRSAGANFVSAIGAGWLIAVLVWLMPLVPNSRFILVLFITAIIGFFGFAHIVAGTAEVFFLYFKGEATLLDMCVTFMAPTLIGNIIGGSALFALITYAQVKREVEESN